MEVRATMGDRFDELSLDGRSVIKPGEWAWADFLFDRLSELPLDASRGDQLRVVADWFYDLAWEEDRRLMSYAGHLIDRAYGFAPGRPSRVA